MTAVLPDEVAQRANKVLASPDSSGFRESVTEARNLFAQRAAERHERSQK